MFIFKYSKRPNTAALQYEDHIPEEEKTRRLMILQEKQRAIQIRRNARIRGRSGRGARGRVQPGDRPVDRPDDAEKTLNFIDPGCANPEDGRTLVGKYLDVLVTRASPNSLAGESIASRTVLQ